MLAINAYVVPLIGPEHVRRNDPPPRVIMYPTADAFSPPIGPGGNPKPILTVEETTEVVIHGETEDHVRGMRDQVLIALHRMIKKSNANKSGRAASYRVNAGRFVRSAMIARNGFEYRLTFGVLVPVVLRKWAAVAPPLPPTYVGAQANTYQTIPHAELILDADVGVRDNPPATDNPEVKVGPTG
jgi:hypothetical protein